MSTANIIDTRAIFRMDMGSFIGITLTKSPLRAPAGEVRIPEGDRFELRLADGAVPGRR